MSAIVDGLRACSKCGVPKCWPASFARPKGAICKTCKALAARVWHHEQRQVAVVERRARIARLAAERAKRCAARAHRRVQRERHVGPFERTVAELVPLWGAYATWTRDQHAQHTEILRKLAGIDDAPREDRADAA